MHPLLRGGYDEKLVQVSDQIGWYYHQAFLWKELTLARSNMKVMIKANTTRENTDTFSKTTVLPWNLIPPKALKINRPDSGCKLLTWGAWLAASSCQNCMWTEDLHLNMCTCIKTAMQCGHVNGWSRQVQDRTLGPRLEVRSWESSELVPSEGRCKLKIGNGWKWKFANVGVAIATRQCQSGNLQA